jgi:hypothetical protein
MGRGKCANIVYLGPPGRTIESLQLFRTGFSEGLGTEGAGPIELRPKGWASPTRNGNNNPLTTAVRDYGQLERA